MGLYSGGLIIGRICASEIWGAYLFIYFFFGGGVIIGILRYYSIQQLDFSIYELQYKWTRILKKLGNRQSELPSDKQPGLLCH